MIENKYDLTQFNPITSYALTASIVIDNLPYFQKIFTHEQLHDEYTARLVSQAMGRAHRVPKNFNEFQDFLLNCEQTYKPEVIKSTAKQVLSSNYHEFIGYYLKSFPIKESMVDSLSSELHLTQSSIDVIQKWKLNQKLNDTLPLKRQVSLRKL